MMLERRWRPGAASDAAVLVLTALATIRRFRWLHASFSPRAAPSLETLRNGRQPYPGDVFWWNWWDQGRYGKAALAWAHGFTTPDWHWYLPGYPLMGAPFVRLTPLDPFLLPDVACLLAALGILVGLGKRLIGRERWVVPLCCGTFLLTAVRPVAVLRDWTIPWTTTPEAVGFLGALLAVVGLADAWRPRWRAWGGGLAVGVVAGCRPADGLVIGLAVGVGAAALLPPRRWISLLPAALSGLALPLLVVGTAYWVVWGFRPSPYLLLSKQYGFEPRQLPLRWVSLVLDPAPVFPRGRGLAEGFVWMVPGLGGLVAALVAPGREGRAVHAVAGAATIADLLLFVCYRDLHPDGPWMYGLHHYFKAVLLVLALYAARAAVLLVRAIRGDGRAAAAVAAGTVAAVLLAHWHLELRPSRQERWGPGTSVELPDGLQPLDAVVMVPGRSLPGAPPSLVAVGAVDGGRMLGIGMDITLPNPGNTTPDLPLLPLRRLPDAQTVVRFISPVALDRSRPPILYEQVIRWGMPRGWWCRLGPPPS